MQVHSALSISVCCVQDSSSHEKCHIVQTAVQYCGWHFFEMFWFIYIFALSLLYANQTLSPSEHQHYIILIQEILISISHSFLSLQDDEYFEGWSPYMLHITNVLKVTLSNNCVSQQHRVDFLHSTHALPFNMTVAHTTTQENWEMHNNETDT